MHLYEYFILWEKRMNEGRPYLQMRRGVWVSFCKIAIVSFLSVGYKLDGLNCRMAGTPSSPTLFFIWVEICEYHCPPPQTHTPTLPNTEGIGWHLDLDTNLSTGFSLKHTHTLPGTEGVGWHIDLDNNLSTPLSNTHTHTHSLVVPLCLPRTLLIRLSLPPTMTAEGWQLDLIIICQLVSLSNIVSRCLAR